MPQPREVIRIEKLGKVQEFRLPSKLPAKKSERAAYLAGFRTRINHWLMGFDPALGPHYRLQADARAYENGYRHARSQEPAV